MKLLLITALALIFLAGCQAASTAQKPTETPAASATEIKDVSPSAAQAEVSKAYSQFIDVRTIEEYEGGHAARAINIPLDSIAENLDKIKKDEPVYIICQTGNRSKKAAVILTEAGFTNVFNVIGGTAAWQSARLPMETKAPHSTKKGEGVKN